jgi:hypothetical protein
MTDGRDWTRDIAEAEQAKAVLDDPLLRQALEELTRETFDLWQRTPSPQEREDLWLRQRGLQMLRLWLERRINQGIISRREMERANRPKTPEE